MHGKDSTFEIHIHSEVWHSFTNFRDWGMDTLTVNGRMKCYNNGYNKLIKAFSLGALSNSEKNDLSLFDYWCLSKEPFPFKALEEARNELLNLTV